MPTVLQKAAKGRRSALTELYNENKQIVYFLCHALLRKPSEAADATAWVFKNTWPAVLEGNIENEGAFTDYVVKKTVGYCKKQILKKDPKALKMPANKSFIIPPVEVSRVNKKADRLTTVLDLLPTLQRFLLVLRVAAEYDADKIADATNLDQASIMLAQEAEIRNLTRIYEAVQKAGGNALPATKELLKLAFDDAAANSIVPQATEARIINGIETIAAPAEKKAKKRRITITAICAALCVVGVIAAVTLPGNDANNDVLSGAEDSDTVLDGTGSESTDSDTETPDDEPLLPSVDEMDANADSSVAETASYYADITIEDYGTITVALDSKAAPITVANFVELAQSGFYDGLTFHRIMEGFMMQGGDPEGNGTGGSDETIVGEFSENGFENDLSHTRGAISMARSSDYDSASSQFFIVQEDNQASLDGKYACFGYVTDGIEIVDAICEAAEPTDSNGTIEAEEQPVISSITIRQINE